MATVVGDHLARLYVVLPMLIKDLLASAGFADERPCVWQQDDQPDCIEQQGMPSDDACALLKNWARIPILRARR